jgi:uncharacterized phage-like protein YoqJ
MIIAGTGHRPKYMPGGYDENDPWQVELKESIAFWLDWEKPSLVISGGAQGFDMFLAEQALLLNIPFDLYLPFKESSNKWPEYSQKRLENLKTKARRVVFTSWNYHPGVFDIRNHAMMDDADLILALYTPELGKTGTSKSVDYAKKKNKSILNLWK